MAPHTNAVGKEPSREVDANQYVDADIAAQVLIGLADTAIGIIALDQKYNIVFANSKFLGLMGIEASNVVEIQGRGFEAYFSDVKLSLSDQTGATSFTEIVDPVGAKHQISWSINRSGGWIGVVVDSPDQTANADLQCYTDELTGLSNRRHLKACFEQLNASGHEIRNRMIALYLDLDQFKQVNDALSHAVGDGLLRKVAERLRKIVRADDVVARIGGDEFAILLSGKSKSAAEAISNRIIKLISRPFLVNGHQVTIGVSVGLACFSEEDEDVEPMLQRADIALYESKRMGRGRFHWFKDDMLTVLTERRDIETDLRKALLLEQFEIDFQPQIAIEGSKISGFEALIRWNHPERGRISPIDFIGIAEETGLIVDIGAWVLNTACKSATNWPDDLIVAVNVSSIQFEDVDFVQSVRLALEVSGLAAHRLELEITETALLQNETVVIEQMKELRALGVKISLDDFGIGYSSLNYLRKYPFDKVKIDQTFVREPFADESSHLIVSAVAQLGTAFGMDVLAEGVETEDQLSRVQLQGCASAQGYLVSPPLAESAIAHFLATPLATLKAPTFDAKTQETEHD